MEEMHQITIEEWMSWREDIREKLRETASNFVYIGYRLKQIRDSGMLDGAADIFEFARKEYGLGKSTVSRFIAINEKFSEGGNSLELRQEYKALGSSKLSEMLTLTDAECQMITEKTTVAEIREFKSFLSQPVPEEEETLVPKEGEKAEEQQSPEEVREGGQQSPEAVRRGETQPLEGSRDKKVLTPLQKCMEDFFRDKKELLNQVIPVAYENRYKDAAELMNPSGHRIHKKGICYISMEDYSLGVKVKLLTEPFSRSMSWEELLREVCDIYSDIYASGEDDIHSAYYGGGSRTAGSSPENAALKGEESPKKLDAGAFVATSQRKEDVESDSAASGGHPEEKEAAPVEPEETHKLPEPEESESAPKVGKKEPEAAAVSEPAEESLPGQMEVADYPELAPVASYEEIPVEDGKISDSCSAESSCPAAGVDREECEDAVPSKDEVDKGQQGSGIGTEEPEGSSASGESVDRPDDEEGETYQDIFMEANKCLYRLDRSFAVWDKKMMPRKFLQEAHGDAISLAAAIEKLLDMAEE